MSKFRHDFNGHIKGIQALYEEKKYEELGEYIEKYYGLGMLKLETSIRTGDVVVDAILAKYSDIAIQNKITVSLQGSFNPRLEVDSFDLCTIFSNAHSNAIEATEKDRKSDKNPYFDSRYKGEAVDTDRKSR